MVRRVRGIVHAKKITQFPKRRLPRVPKFLHQHYMDPVATEKIEIRADHMVEIANIQYGFAMQRVDICLKTCGF